MTLQEIFGASKDNEGTSFPWWFIVNPSCVHAKALSTNRAISAMAWGITGPFFSRKEAEETLDFQRHNLGPHAVVWCGSGHLSRGYRALLELAR